MATLCGIETTAIAVKKDRPVTTPILACQPPPSTVEDDHVFLDIGRVRKSCVRLQQTFGSARAIRSGNDGA